MSFIEVIYEHSPVWFQHFMTTIEGMRRKKMRVNNRYFVKWKEVIQRFEGTDKLEIDEWQTQQLTSYVASAYFNSKFWKDALTKVGYRPDQKISVRELQYLPIIDKALVLANKNDFFNVDCQAKLTPFLH